MAPPPPPPELNDDVTVLILLRISPDEPADLFRAALVCKPWLRVLCDPAFLRRYRSFHGAPPLLGVLHRLDSRYADPRLVPTTAVPLPAFPYPAPASGGRRRPLALDCRHGRVLLHMLTDESASLLVWDPVTGDRHGFPEPDIEYSTYSAAVLCAAAGCDHLECHGSAFRVAFVASLRNVIWASVYSSETGAWSTPKSVLNSRDLFVKASRGALIGDIIYFSLSPGRSIVKYDWDKNCLSMISSPLERAYNGYFVLMVLEDSSLGIAGIDDSSFYLWSRKVNAEGAAEWMCRVSKLDTMIPIANPKHEGCVLGFAEDLCVIFVSTSVGIFAVNLKSGKVRKVDMPRACLSVLPYTSFYTPDGSKLSLLARTN
ncbi:hypothetical protein ACP70R_014557 [Stipagrostis hirtigluma subsp. patula]